jgi:hypothetical protein
VRLVGFIIRIYRDARSSECQIRQRQNVLRLSEIEQAIPVVQSVASLLYRIRCHGCVNVAYLVLLSVTPGFMLQKN